ncbi:hypothetical protein E4T44_00604 [Aureobasidium sp. EXF-8845]|nr:hypothetical protein E4T44_00604 [Aureobasidium sp. EXF-8845]KAI4857905.1 hypothetical protein E4T45_00586 [Aureobasidium sp. EXF-8846]
MLLYLDESAAFEKAIVSSLLMVSNWPTCLYKVRASVKVRPALDINGYLPGATLVVEGAVTQAIYEHWLETVVLPQCEPFPGSRWIVIMNKCSTHHSDKLGEQFGDGLLRLLNMRSFFPLNLYTAVASSGGASTAGFCSAGSDDSGWRLGYSRRWTATLPSSKRTCVVVEKA